MIIEIMQGIDEVLFDLSIDEQINLLKEISSEVNCRINDLKEEMLDADYPRMHE